MLVGIEPLDQAELRIEPMNARVTGVEYLAQSVAHQLDDGLEVQMCGDAPMDAVDKSQLGSARVPFGYTPLDRALQPLRPSHVVERDRGVRSKHRQQVAVGFIEATSVAFDVRVEATQ